MILALVIFDTSDFASQCRALWCEAPWEQRRMKREVDEKGKGNLGQERGNSFAVATLSQQQSSSALRLACRSMGQWVLLQASTTEAQEGVWAGPRDSMPVGYGQERAEGTLPTLLAIWCRRYHGNLVFFSPFSVSRNRAGCDFWMLHAGGGQEVGGEGRPRFQGFQGAACRGSSSVGANKAAVSSYQPVPMMNGRLPMMEQIDHRITCHNLLISAKRAIHYCAHHRDTVIPADNFPAALAWASYHPNTPSSRRKWWRSSLRCLTRG